MALTAARPTGAHRTHGEQRLRAARRGSILTLPLVRLALALARRGFTASAIHSASATSPSVSVKLLQFTQAAEFRPPGCHMTGLRHLGVGGGNRSLYGLRLGTN